MLETNTTLQERLTAYALNELDPGEREAVEAQLKNDPDAQAYITDIRATALVLETELKQEKLDELTRTLASAKPAKPGSASVRPVPMSGKPVVRLVGAREHRTRRFFAYAAACAAMLAVGVVYLQPMISSKRSSQAEMISLKSVAPDSPRMRLTEHDGLVAQKTPQYTSAVGSGVLIPLDESKTANQPVSSAIVVPPVIVEKARVGDHFETVDLTRPDSISAHGNPDAKLFFSADDKNGSMRDKDKVDGLINTDYDRHIAKNEEKSVFDGPANKPLKPIPGGVGRGIGDSSSSFGNRGGTVRKIDPPEVKAPVKKMHSIVNHENDSPAKAPAPVAIIAPASKPVASVLTPEMPTIDNTKHRDHLAYDFKKDKEEGYKKAVPPPSDPKSKDQGLDAKIPGLTPAPAPASIELPHIVTPPPVTVPGESYAVYPENGFESVRTAPLSTFSADVDTASFANVRRFLNSNQLPPVDAVRTEELINYFKYRYDTIKFNDPFGVNVEAAACPWNAAHRLVRVAIVAQEIAAGQRPAGNFVFLIDVSGSMDAPNRLPLVREGIKALVRKLEATDRVAIVTYAGESGVALPSTLCSEKDRIISVIDSLRAAGSTNGGAGIQTAYATAKQNYIKGGINRVVLATDGDFNVGVTSTDALIKMVADQATSGVFLTALGYGMGNYKDATLQKLADKGNGNYAYIDTEEESRKVLVEQMQGTLITVAKDVKFQVEFNPNRASAYRLIGYEKRALAAKDFNDDTKDAGEVGAGHTVTAFYEVVPGTSVESGVDPLKYQQKPAEPAPVKADGASPEMLTLKIRYKQPEGAVSKRLEFAFTDKGGSLEQASTDFKFGTAVALFGQILKHSPNVQNATLRKVIDLADESRGNDEGGYRKEFIQLARKAAELRGER
ncbi:MAG: von Willebrand factor type A domain-containing protein [Planctomycetota bacterium]